MFVEERGDPIYGYIAIFYKKEMFKFKQQLSISLSDGATVSKLKRGGKLQNFPGAVTNPRPSNCIWDKANLFASISLCSGSSQYSILFKSLFNADFFYFWDKP